MNVLKVSMRIAVGALLATSLAGCGMLGGKSGYIRRFEWTPPDGVAVTQIQLYYAEEGRGYTATATTPSTQFERFEMQFRQLLGGLALDVT